LNIRFSAVQPFLLITAILGLISCGQQGADDAAPDTAPVASSTAAVNETEIARDAYLYGFPMVMNLKTIYDYVVNQDSPDYKGPWNEVACEARLFTPADTAVVTPNSDTPYCMFWLDLRREPLVLAVPEMEPDRYYSVQLIDFYTHNYAYIGTRSYGNDAGNYLLAAPGWEGSIPDGIDDVLRSETDLVFAVVRVQLKGADDLDRVREIQDSLSLRSLSEISGNPPPPPVPDLEFPEWVAGAERDLRAFDYVDVALDLVPPHPDEAALRERFKLIGIGDEKAFRSAALDEESAAALAAGMEQALEQMQAFVASNSGDPLMSARIFGTRESLMASAASMGLPDIYLPRAVAAMTGLYGNTGAEALYPAYFTDSDGEPLDAAQHSYRMRIPPGGMPPAKAFWSLSMYDGKTQLFIDNPLNRYLLNSTMESDFVREPDGSVVLYLQSEAPPEPLMPNWLPSPDGPFYAVMRLYLPTDEVLQGDWTPPAITKAAASIRKEVR